MHNRESPRVLAVHNFYFSGNPSGENVVFDAECDLLRRNGHQVDIHVRRSDEIRAQGTWGAVKGALATPWNPFEARKLREEVERLRPCVVHVHNTFPLISPAVFRAIGRRAARVLTLHNYRLACPAAIPMRDGEVCTECIERISALPSLVHGCYRNSRLATVPLAASVALHRWIGTWRNEVDAFIVLTDFQKERMAKTGLPRQKIHVKPNFFPGHPKVIPWDERTLEVLFVGRLSEEKGLDKLLAAWDIWKRVDRVPRLTIIGDGPLKSEVTRRAEQLAIDFRGATTPSNAHSAIAHAKLLVVPSQCFEGFPMVVREAFAFGTPVAVSDIGPLPAIVKNGGAGIVCRTDTAESLLEGLRSAWRDVRHLTELSARARREFEESYTEEVNYQTLRTIYEAAQHENLKA
jgi:glycosyltransferase involved in cell wall biosynthesis